MANNCVKALPPCELRTHQYEPLVREGFSLFFIQISPSGNEQLVYKNAGAGLGKGDLPNITLGAALDATGMKKDNFYYHLRRLKHPAR